jgi:hypothetical protein
MGEKPKSSFTITGAQDMLGKLMDMITAQTPTNYEFVNEAGQVVKSGYTNMVTGEVSDNTVFVNVRITDTSSDAYEFKHLYIYGKWDTEEHLVIKHTFAQVYSKRSDQTLDCIVKTGIAGCVG